jgi:hypothetical protein
MGATTIQQAHPVLQVCIFAYLTHLDAPVQISWKGLSASLSMKGLCASLGKGLGFRVANSDVFVMLFIGG